MKTKKLSFLFNLMTRVPDSHHCNLPIPGLWYIFMYVCVYMCIYGKTQTGLLYMKNLNVCFFFVPHLRTDFFELHTEEIFSFFSSFFSLSTALPWYAFGFYYCSQLWQYKCNNSAFFLANNEAIFFFNGQRREIYVSTHYSVFF